MKNKSINRILTANKMILAGLGIGVLYWILESAMHALVFHRGSLVERILAPGLSTILVRLLVMGLFFMFAVYAQFVITQRKRAEEALKESVGRWSSLVDNAPNLIAILDRNGVFQFVNRTVPGLTVEEVIGTKTHDYILPEYHDVVREKIEHVFDTGEAVYYELRGVGPHGETRWYETRVGPLIIDGEIAHVTQISSDITERKRAEEALQGSEENFRTLAENAFDGILIAADEGVTVYANKRATEITGYSVVELLKTSIRDLAHPDEFDKIMARYRRRLEGKPVPREYETVIIRKDGKSVPIGLAATKTVWQGKPADLVFFRDITERKRSEEALQHSLEETARGQRLLLALSQAAQAVQRARTPEEVYQTVGDEVARLGYNAAILALTDDQEHLALRHLTFEPTLVQRVGKLTGLSAQDFRFPLMPGGYFQRIIAGGEPTFQESALELMVEALPKPLHPLVSRLVAMLDIEQGIVAPLAVGDERLGVLAVTGVGLTEADVPAVTAFANQAAIAIENARLFEQVQAGREQLRDLAGYLQAAREEERTHIAREIHDEFGQALSALKMDLSWLSKRLPADQPHLAEKASAMSDLIDSATQTVRRVATELRPGLLDDLGLAAAMEWQAEEFTERTGIDCDLYLSNEEIVLDRDLATAIFRIFQETLTNVARHAQATEVHVELEDRPDELVLIVRDNGRGITESQLSDPKSLGLMGIRERAHSWGGEVAFQGVAGQGTTVTVRIPNAECRMRNSESSR